MTLPAQDIVERLLSPLAISKEHRDQAADTISRLTADNEALRKENERLSEEKDALAFGARHGQSLSEDAIHAIRELLNEAGVPLAAFIDDHVGNAIVQRNQERARADALAQEVEKLRELVQKAFKDGVLYGTNVDVSDVWQAWLSSKVREELAASSRPLPLQETEK